MILSRLKMPSQSSWTWPSGHNPADAAQGLSLGEWFSGLRRVAFQTPLTIGAGAARTEISGERFERDCRERIGATRQRLNGTGHEVADIGFVCEITFHQKIKLSRS